MKINLSQIPCEQAAFLAKFESYRTAMEAHRLTVNVPAPFPEFEVFRVAWEKGEAIEVHDDTPPPPPAPTAPELAQRALEQKRSEALRALEDQRLAAAMADPLAPQAVKDFAAAAKATP